MHRMQRSSAGHGTWQRTWPIARRENGESLGETCMHSTSLLIMVPSLDTSEWKWSIQWYCYCVLAVSIEMCALNGKFYRPRNIPSQSCEKAR